MSSTMFNKPLDTEFVGTVNGLSERIDDVNDKIGTVPSGKTVEGQISSLSEQIANVVHYKMVELPLSITGSNWSPTSRNIGSVQNIFGVNTLVSAFAYDAAFNPAAIAVFGVYNNNVYASATQTATLNSSMKVQVGYVD